MRAVCPSGGDWFSIRSPDPARRSRRRMPSAAKASASNAIGVMSTWRARPSRSLPRSLGLRRTSRPMSACTCVAHRLALVHDAIHLDGRSACPRPALARPSARRRPRSTPSTTCSMPRCASSSESPRPERHAEAAVAGLIVGAGEHQIAEAGEPHEGVALRRRAASRGASFPPGRA